MIAFMVVVFSCADNIGAAAALQNIYSKDSFLAMIILLLPLQYGLGVPWTF